MSIKLHICFAVLLCAPACLAQPFTMNDQAFLAQQVVADPIPKPSLNIRLFSSVGVLTTGGAAAGNGDPVYRWLNQVTPAGFDQLADPGPNYPVYHTTGGPNGQPFIRMLGDGGLGSWQEIETGGHHTVFVVFENLLGPGAGGIADQFFYELGYPSPQNAVFQFFYSGQGPSIPLFTPTNTWFLLTVCINNAPSTSTVRTNGVQFGSQVVDWETANWDDTAPSFGSPTRWYGDIACYLDYFENLSAGQIGNIETNLMVRYGIPH